MNVVGPDLSPVECLADMVIICPPIDAHGPAAEIRARGNCPLEIGSAFLAEISLREMKANWNSTCKLSSREVTALTRQLGHSLAEAELGQELDRKLGEAAAFFLLALRHNKLSAEAAISNGAMVVWHADTGSEEVEYMS
jgi:hypothetical protein